MPTTTLRPRRMRLIIGVLFIVAAIPIAMWAITDPLARTDWQWTGAAAFCAFFVWVGCANSAFVCGSHVRSAGDQMELRTFLWYRFRTVTIAPGSGHEIIHRSYRQNLVKVEVLNTRAAGRRRSIGFLLMPYKRPDRQAIIRNAKEIARIS